MLLLCLLAANNYCELHRTRNARAFYLDVKECSVKTSPQRQYLFASMIYAEEMRDELFDCCYSGIISCRGAILAQCKVKGVDSDLYERLK